MAKVSTTVTIDSDIKAEAQALLADFGLDLSTAINIFLRQTVRENAIPFSISREVPNSDTITALKEFEEFKKHPDKYKRYSAFSEIIDEVEHDA
ncbi:MAG: type II toxin-antitoxin system RelB/DinJ family antitoxin [Clostridia bacterium]|nr:type II toxin-antitoxin system RelB/DinJ family antitoxin [Clostridia bacterium]